MQEGWSRILEAGCCVRYRTGGCCLAPDCARVSAEGQVKNVKNDEFDTAVMIPCCLSLPQGQKPAVWLRKVRDSSYDYKHLPNRFY